MCIRDRHADKEAIQQDVEQRDPYVKPHAVTNLSADTQIVVNGKKDCDNRRKQGIDPEVFYGQPGHSWIRAHEAQQRLG